MGIFQTLSDYASFVKNENRVKQYPGSDVKPDQLVTEGEMFDILSGTIVDSHEQTAESVIIKHVRERATTKVYDDYVRAVAEIYRELYSPYVIMCLGDAPGCLMMECVSFGNLRQYLCGLSNSDKFDIKQFMVNGGLRFVDQIAEGMDAILNLKLEFLFYCLSADHVLLGERNTCKLTEFSRAENIREKWEEKNGIRYRHTVLVRESREQETHRPNQKTLE